MATAECIYADRLGNCYFNIRKDQFEAFTGTRLFHIRIQHYLGVEFKKLVEIIRDANPGEAIFRFSKSGYLMLQIHQGNAKQLFRIKDDTKIIIELQ
jgi:S-adenosylmethionine hydrolase